MEAALAAPDLAEAQLLLLEMEPAQLRAAQSRVEALKARLEEDAAVRAQAEKQQARRVAVALTERKKAEMKAAFESVQRRFGEGDYARAALECDRVAERYPSDEAIRARAKLLKTLLPSFGKAFEDGHRKFKQGQLGAAARPLKRARDLYAQMGMEGSLGRVLDEELGSSAVAAAESALAREDWAGAHTYFEEALKLTPGDERAAAGLGQVRRKLEEVYLSAYMLADREPKEALARLRTVLGVVRPGEPLHEKATALKERLQP
jgi:tetratricopeptide (TPR) repeat protein